jgi:HlyD family secretion protein
MQTRTKVIIGIIVVVALSSAAALQATRAGTGGVEVRMEEIARRDLVELVTASGNIRARRTVNISSDVTARVQRLLVDEGDDVVAGQVLLRLEPDQYEAALAQTEASLAQSQAQQDQQRANLLRTQRDLDRLLALRARDSLLTSPQQVDDAATNVEVAEATLSSARYGVAQAQAAVEEAEEQLSKTVFIAPMDGRVTRLNIEEGETVIIGTTNNPGSLVLTISDLSVMEVVVQVDETDVPEIQLGDSADIRIDAFADEEFTGRVTEIGNSAINPPSAQAAGQQAAIDFEVVITLDATDALLRPDLSATADIVTEVRGEVLSVPIIAVTVREAKADSAGDASDRDDEPEDFEGVFVVSDGVVTFTAVGLGIAGQEYFEILWGAEVGDTVVAGPYQMIRQLVDGDQVKESDGRVVN